VGIRHSSGPRWLSILASFPSHEKRVCQRDLQICCDDISEMIKSYDLVSRDKTQAFHCINRPLLRKTAIPRSQQQVSLYDKILSCRSPKVWSSKHGPRYPTFPLVYLRLFPPYPALPALHMYSMILSPLNKCNSGSPQNQPGTVQLPYQKTPAL
jgi:hypothetical protein